MVRQSPPQLLIPKLELLGNKAANQRFILTTRAHPYFKKRLAELGPEFLTPLDVQMRVEQEAREAQHRDARRAVTVERVIATVLRMAERGVRPTQTAVATELGVHRSTIQRYWGDVKYFLAFEMPDSPILELL